MPVCATASERILGAALVVTAIAVPALAHAQPQGNSTVAQSLFDRARQLMDAGSFSEACPLLEESHRLDPAGGTLLNLALCREKEGKLATAYARFNEALSGAIRDGREDRRKLAQERIDALGPQLSKITLRVPPESDIPGLVIELDRTSLPKAAWGTPTAVDGGSHRIAASAPYRRAWVSTVEIKPSGEVREVVIPVLPAAAGAPPAGYGYGYRPALPPTCPQDFVLIGQQCVKNYDTRWSTATYVVGAASLAAVGAGALTGILALVSQSDSKTALEDAGCLPERQYCDDADAVQEAVDAQERAHTLGWVSTIAFGVGAVGFVTALLLPRDRISRGAKTPKVGFVSTRGGGGLSLTFY